MIATPSLQFASDNNAGICPEAMAALAADRDTKQVDGVNYEYPQAAVKIYAGAIVAMNSAGFATKGATSAKATPCAMRASFRRERDAAAPKCPRNG